MTTKPTKPYPACPDDCPEYRRPCGCGWAGSALGCGHSQYKHVVNAASYVPVESPQKAQQGALFSTDTVGRDSRGNGLDVA